MERVGERWREWGKEENRRRLSSKSNSHKNKTWQQMKTCSLSPHHEIFNLSFWLIYTIFSICI